MNRGNAKERLRERRKKRKLKRILTLLLVFVILLTGGIATAAYLSTNVYQDDEEFKEYAGQKLKDEQIFKVKGKTEQEYDYGSPISYAVDYQILDNELISVFRHEKIAEAKEKFKNEKTKAEAQRAEKNKDNSRYRPLEEALIIDTAVYESNNGAVSLAVHCSENEEYEKDMVNRNSYVDTYLVSAETGKSILPVQALKNDYRQKCYVYFKEYFPKIYSKDELSENWEEYIAPNNQNFNKFIMTDDNIVFYFDRGTVLKESKGFVTAKVSNIVFGDSIRSSIIERYIQPDKPMVAITYDDGPGGESEEKILDCLEKNGAVATFFYLGSRVSGNSNNIRRAMEIGCEIGNHTWSHPILTNLTKKQAAAEVHKTNEAVKRACGQYPTVFRPSYGMTYKSINKLSDMPVIMWSVDTLDWKTRSAKKTFKAIKNTKKLDGKIILMHSIHDSTADATELIIPWLRKNGYQTVTVSELIEYKTGKPAEKGHVYW